MWRNRNGGRGGASFFAADNLFLLLLVGERGVGIGGDSTERERGQKYESLRAPVSKFGGGGGGGGERPTFTFPVLAFNVPKKDKGAFFPGSRKRKRKSRKCPWQLSRENYTTRFFPAGPKKLFYSPSPSYTAYGTVIMSPPRYLAYIDAL